MRITICLIAVPMVLMVSPTMAAPCSPGQRTDLTKLGYGPADIKKLCGNASALFDTANKKKQSGDLKSAELLIEQGLKIEPRNAQGKRNLADVKDAFGSAQKLFEQGYNAKQAGDLKASQKLFEQGLGIDAANDLGQKLLAEVKESLSRAQTLFEQGYNAKQAGDLKTAQQLFEQGLAIEPGNELGQKFLAEAKVSMASLPGKEDNNLYLYDGTKKIRMELARTESEGKVLIGALLGVGRGYLTFPDNGAAAAIRVTNMNPSFGELGGPLDGRIADYCYLIKLEIDSETKQRRVQVAKVSLFDSKNQEFAQEARIPVIFREIGEATSKGNRMRTYMMTPEAPLAPGEYAIALPSGNHYFDFGIDATPSGQQGERTPQMRAAAPSESASSLFERAYGAKVLGDLRSAQRLFERGLVLEPENALGKKYLLEVTDEVARLQSNPAAATAGIQGQLESRFALSRTTAGGGDIAAWGSVLVLQTNNLVLSKVLMKNGQLSLPAENVFENGQIGQVGLLGSLMKLNSVLTALGNPDAPSRAFGGGEKFWVTRIGVEADGITFQLMSDPVNGARYHGKLRFPYAKGDILAANQAAILATKVLTVDPS